MIYLNSPEETEKFKLKGEDLIAVNRERGKTKKDEEMRQRQETSRPMGGRPGMEGMTPEMIEQFRNARGAQGAAGAGRTRDTAAMRRFQQTRTNQQGTNPQGATQPRDTTVRRRVNNDSGQQPDRQNAPAQTQTTIRNNN